MGFKRILCPTDFSECSRQALQVASRLAVEHGAQLDIVHVWHVPGIAYSEYSIPSDLVRQLEEDARLGIGAAVRDATAAGVARITSKLLIGAPWVEITTYLEHHPFDLCVIGSHGRTGMRRVLLGSVAENVVRHAPCAVLTVRADTDYRTFRRVLVPTDFSESAAPALALAATLVVPDGTLLLLHVLELPFGYSRAMPIDLFPDLERRVAAALEASVQRMESATRASVKGLTRTGRPGAETLHLLDDDQEIDLVITGSHGRTGIARVLMGSVAEKLVRHAPCPVLVARTRDGKDLP